MLVLETPMLVLRSSYTVELCPAGANITVTASNLLDDTRG